MLYLDNRHLFSHNCHIIMIIGARGIGKTYSTKKLVLKKFFYKNEKFIWLRATDTMTDTLKENNGLALFSDLLQNKEFDNFDWTGKIEGDGTISISKDASSEKPTYEYCGRLMALSTFYKMKGNSFADIDTVVFDEFIAEKNEVIRGDRALQFVNTIETIGRLRKNYRIILLANALDLADPILNLFFKKITKYGYYINREKDCILYYAEDSKEFTEKRFESISGKILKGTDYEDTIAHNKFLSFDGIYFDKKPSGLSFFCVLENGVQRENVYLGDDKIYVTQHNNCKTNNIYAPNLEIKSDKAKVIPKQLKQRFQTLYGRGCILFDGETSRKNFVEFIK